MLNEIDRNLQDAMSVVRNILVDPRVVPGGGAVEMSIAQALTEKSKTIVGVQQWPYRAVANAFEVIPRTLAQNCGAHTVRVLTALRAKHAGGANTTWGIDGNKGVLTDMMELKVWESVSVKTQTIKTSIEVRVWIGCSAGHGKNGKGRVGVKWRLWSLSRGVCSFCVCSQAAAMLLRIDDIVSGIKQPRQGGGQQEPTEEQKEQMMAEVGGQ